MPRFDRVVHAGGVTRYGLESLCSLAGVAESGARISQEKLLDALTAASSTPEEDAAEFISRDILNLALANTDNHARNSSVLKRDDGSTVLSPLYDVAPMALDPEGIPRACRWNQEPPQWKAIAGPRWERVRAFGKQLHTLPEILQRCDVDKEVFDYLQPRVKALTEQF